MNALPSMTVLDFCEWLKKHVTQQCVENHIDMFNLIFNDECRDNLRQLAKEYLQDGDNSIRELLHRFIDSEEFDRCCKHCHFYFSKKWNHHRLHPNELRHLLLHCYHCSEVDRAYERFVCHCYYDEDAKNFIYDERVTPEALAASVKFYFNHQKNEPFVMNFMTMLSADLSLEIDFLEWLMLNKGKPMNLNEMPLPLFESIADEYCNYANRFPDDKQKLVKAFKQRDPISLGKKLLAILSRTQAERMKSLGYIYDRYVSKKIPFRCFFLPLASNGNAFENFIKKNWADLNSLSSDYLDIYYSEEDYGKSGYAIKGSMQMISKNLSEKLPCLVIWQDNLQCAQTIDIEGLLDSEIVQLIAGIVGSIKSNTPLNTISSKAKEMAKKFNQAHIDANRPISYNTFNIENNTGVVTSDISNSTVTVYTGSITNTGFETETKKAIDIINSFTDVERKYRDVLISLVKEANVAVQKKDAAAKAECKSKFNGFMLGAGSAIGIIITKFSELATIADFFGIATNIFHP